MRSRLGKRRMWRNTPVTPHITTCRKCGHQFTTDTLHTECPACRREQYRKRKT